MPARAGGIPILSMRRISGQSSPSSGRNRIRAVPGAAGEKDQIEAGAEARARTVPTAAPATPIGAHGPAPKMNR